MRSSTMTSGRQKSQCTAGTYRREEPSKLRRSCEALPASRIRSSSSRMVFSYSRTTSMGLRRWLPSQLSVGERGQRVQHFEIARDHRVHARTQHLDHDFAGLGAVERHLGSQLGGVHLRDRGGGQRLLVERREHLLGGAAVGVLDDGARDAAVEGRHAILQLGQLVGDVGGQQVAARGQGLAELHEDRAEFLQRLAQPHGARLLRGGAPPRSRATAGTGSAAAGTGAWRARIRRGRGAPARAGSR